MTNSNDTLPENLKGLVSNLSTRQAMPLGMISEIPFLALKIAPENEPSFLENPVVYSTPSPTPSTPSAKTTSSCGTGSMKRPR